MTLNKTGAARSDLVDPSVRKHKFVTLDGMRGIAALCVLLYHGTNMTSHMAAVAYAAVDVFFALSGFVIAYSYGQRLSSVGVATFVRVRLIRLYPLYLLGLVLGVLTAVSTHVAWIESGHLGMAVVLGLFFLPDLSVGALFPLNNPAWSLFFELAVNGLYAVLRPGFRWLLFLIVAAGLLCAAMTVKAGHAMGAEPATFLGGFPRVMFSFYSGVAIHDLWRRNLLPKIRIHPLIICALLFLVLALSIPGWHGPQYFLTVFLLSPIFIIVGCQNEATGVAVPFCRWMGMVSYGLYTLHDPLRQMVEHFFGRQDILTLSITLLTSVTVAHFATLWIDRPVRELLSKKRPVVAVPQISGP